ncbi:MAG: DUF2800 domain-containing protein [Lachnospiraceae bacterium]|nr:DUF2800 domain-containing protein [Lachnospiraceae bacterium]
MTIYQPRKANVSTDSIKGIFLQTDCIFSCDRV